MRLRISENKNGTKNLYVLKSFRNSKGKSTTKIVEKLGNYANRMTNANTLHVSKVLPVKLIVRNSTVTIKSK